MVNSLHFIKIITKARNDENTKEKKNFVLYKFRVFVISPFWFSASVVGWVETVFWMLDFVPQSNLRYLIKPMPNGDRSKPNMDVAFFGYRTIIKNEKI